MAYLHIEKFFHICYDSEQKQYIPNTKAIDDRVFVEKQRTHQPLLEASTFFADFFNRAYRQLKGGNVRSYFTQLDGEIVQLLASHPKLDVLDYLQAHTTYGKSMMTNIRETLHAIENHLQLP